MTFITSTEAASKAGGATPAEGGDHRRDESEHRFNKSRSGRGASKQSLVRRMQWLLDEIKQAPDHHVRLIEAHVNAMEASWTAFAKGGVENLGSSQLTLAPVRQLGTQPDHWVDSGDPESSFVLRKIVSNAELQRRKDDAKGWEKARESAEAAVQPFKRQKVPPAAEPQDSGSDVD